VFDADIKGSSVAATLKDMGHPFGLFVNMIKETEGMRELEYLAFFRKKLDAMNSDKFDAIIYDGFSWLENCLHPYVEANPKEFRTKWSAMGAIKGAQMWQSAGQLESVILQQMLDIAPLVLITTHLKNHTIGSKRTGKMIPDCKKALVQKAALRVWLRAGDPEPSGLLLKRISKPVIDASGRMSFKSVVPRKMTPFTWDELEQYWNDPIDKESAEQLTEEEISIIENTLTEDQLAIARLNLIYGDDFDGDRKGSFSNKLVERVLELDKEDMSIPKISRALDIKPAEVAKILKENR